MDRIVCSSISVSDDSLEKCPFSLEGSIVLAGPTSRTRSLGLEMELASPALLERLGYQERI
jgi:hypothetical protein